MTLTTPTPEDMNKTMKVLHELIERINTGDITLQQAADVGLNLFAQMSLELRLDINETLTAIVQAREHILRQMPAQKQPTSTH